MKRIQVSIFSVFIIILGINDLFPQQPDLVVKKTESFLQELGKDRELSLALLIAKDGIPILKKAYGMANRSDGILNQTDTKFNLASMNKMFTSIAILQLVQEGGLSLEDKIMDHVPDYPNETVKSSVTIHQLLTHTAGMGNIFGDIYDSSPLVLRYKLNIFN